MDTHYDPEYATYLRANPTEIDKVKKVVHDELFMPAEDLNNVNTFMESLDVQDRIQIKYLAYIAPEPYRELFFRYFDEFEITSTTSSGAFNSSKNTLVFNIFDDRTNDRGAYYTFFH